MSKVGQISPSGLINALIDECGALKQQLSDDRTYFSSLTLKNIHERNQEKLSIVEKLELMASQLSASLDAGSVDMQTKNLLAKFRAVVTGCENEVVTNTRFIGKYIEETRKIFMKISNERDKVPLYDKSGITTP